MNKKFDTEQDDASLMSNSGSEGDDSATSPSTASGKSSESQNLAREETRWVSLLRLTVILVLIFAAALVSFFVYRFSSSMESEDFQNEFIGHSTKVIESWQLNAEGQLAALHSFSVTLTSYAKERNDTWPFVTVPDFERRAHSVLSQVKSVSMLLHPIVTKENRAKWEQYSVDNFDGFTKESLDFQRSGGYNRTT
jgi:hypothetical protein